MTPSPAMTQMPLPEAKTTLKISRDPKMKKRPLRLRYVPWEESA